MNPLLKDIFAEAKQIVELANKSSLKIGTAESCTGGLIGGAITAISGSSACFQGGIIAYDNAIKQSLLSVPLSTLDSYGAVSQQTAAEMAEGALRNLNIDIAISVTGIAGPSGGTAQKPVGTVWIGLATKTQTQTHLFEFGDIGRNRVRDQACYEALKVIKLALETA